MAAGITGMESGYGCRANGLKGQSQGSTGCPDTGEKLREDGSGFPVTGDKKQRDWLILNKVPVPIINLRNMLQCVAAGFSLRKIERNLKVVAN